MNAARFYDFPDWLSPMLVKELRQGLKTRGFTLTFIGLQIVLAFALGYQALLVNQEGAGSDQSGFHVLFWSIIGFQLLFASPMRALNSLANEQKSQTLELLFMSGLTSWRIAWGKWVSLQFQSLLFVLAVLPYGLLRYFFGGVNVTEEMQLLTWMCFGSAIFSAIAIAISALPNALRLLASAGAIFSTIGLSQFIIFGFGHRGGTSPVSETWPLFVYDAALLGLFALQTGAALIAPPAENHALRQRLILLALALPLPLLYFGTSTWNGSFLPQTILFGCLVGGISFWHLAILPNPMRVHFEGPARGGFIGFFSSLPFQPGWPGALLFMITAQLIVLLCFSLHEHSLDHAIPIFLMGGAAILSATLFWRLLRSRGKQLLLKHIVFLLICGALAPLIEIYRQYPSTPDIETALLPPLGFWVMLNQPNHEWMGVSFVMFAIQSVALLLIAIPFWRRAFSLHRDISSARAQAKLAA